MSTSGRNRFDLCRVRVSLSNFRSGSGRVIVSGQTFPTLCDTIFINMEGSKKYYNEVKRDVEQVAKEIAESNHYPGYKIKVTRVTVEVRAADKGSQIIPAIAEGLLSKKEYKVTGVGYKSKPFIIMISTSIQSSDLTAKELGMKIDKEISEYLKSEDILSILGDEKVKVIVYSKDKKKIN